MSDRAVIGALSAILVFASATACTVTEKPIAAVADQYRCTTTTEQRSAARDKVATLDPASDWLYPGSILRPDSADSRQFVPSTGLPRAPLTYSISTQLQLAGTHSATLPNPSLSAYRDSLAGLLGSGTSGATAADLHWDSMEITQADQVGLFLGAGAGVAGTARVGVDFKWSDTSVRSRALIRFTQTYFTVDVDKPATPAGFFAPDAPRDEVDRLLGASPAYVSSVAYGRTAVIAFESTYAGNEVTAALNAKLGWNFGLTTVDGGAGAWHESALRNTRFSGYILGGSGADAARSFDGLDAVKAYIADGGNYSASSPGAPIFYRLTDIEDNTTTGAGQSVDYPVRKCERQRGKVGIRLVEIRVDSDDDVDVCGWGFARNGDSRVALFDRDCTKNREIAVEPARPWRPDAVQVLDVATSPGQTIDITIRLVASVWNGFEEIETRVAKIGFEDGWRGTHEIRFAHEAIAMTAVLELVPG
ncbi:thiol-activated cytolysin family protein [Actinosynnema sp. NPDC020468]|uniref:thiol-activated cytolysin family protein n=1 Tax=Actinosynnema sp. NPDC020468 TaxID=3154488 RepID=UPI0033FDBA39